MVVTTSSLGYWVHEEPNNNSETFGSERKFYCCDQALEPWTAQTLKTMAEGSSRNAAHVHDDMHGPSVSSASMLSSSRSRPKLGRSSTLNWFNKSFDQSALRQESKTTKHRQMRRQSSVSDFFQSMISKGKNHIVGILSSKKDRSDERADIATELERGKDCSPKPLRVSRASIEFSMTSESHQTDKYTNTFPDKSSSPHKTNTFSEIRALSKSDKTVNFDLNRDKHIFGEASSPTNNFIVKSVPGENNETTQVTLQNTLVKSPCESVTSAHAHGSSKSICASQTPVDIFLRSTFASPAANHHPLISRKASLQSQCSKQRRSFGETKDDMATAHRAVSSAPPGHSRHSGTNSNNSLMVEDAASLFKRALVKSSSETFHTKRVDQLPLVKASSDGNCFKRESTWSLGSPNTVISRITNYLFLGSIEAAYSEPLLCKSKITSLIDMTNMPSTDVPLHKKTDCPCACVSKNHFRSRLNIGVDDIEWENMEQYYDVINAFINGARTKGGRILIFSYMGQSRAAAATAQHLMCQYKIPFNEAYHIIKSKRPQTKINSGFIKALLRLEKTLGLPDDDDAVKKQRQWLQKQHSEEITTSKHEPVASDEQSVLFPRVVRGAWLEC